MTILPIDYRRSPWKPKYLTEETAVLNRWFVFGEYKNGDVDISDGNQDIFVRIPLDVAEEIINARNELADVVEKHLCCTKTVTISKNCDKL